MKFKYRRGRNVRTIGPYLRRDEDKLINFKELTSINPYLSLSIFKLGDKEREAINQRINDTIKKVLLTCQYPKSIEEMFEKIQLYKNTQKEFLEAEQHPSHTFQHKINYITKNCNSIKIKLKYLIIFEKTFLKV